MIDKKELRKKAKRLLANIDASLVNELSTKLSLRLIQYLNSQDIQISNIGAFDPIQKEPKWYLSFIEKKSNYSFSFPGIESEGVMSFYSDHKFKVGKETLGISFEKEKLHELEKVSPDVLLIPGLLFSHEGARLGRGKGFYDRYLTGFKGIRIGLCFEAQLEKELQIDQHDEHVDIIITELKTYSLKRK